MANPIAQPTWERKFKRLLEAGYTIEEAVHVLDGGTLPMPIIDLDQIEARANHEAWWNK